jgi:hypothetical protein
VFAFPGSHNSYRDGPGNSTSDAVCRVGP